MNKTFPSYIVVTPCKNEEWNFSNLVISVKSQTIRPTLWVIVDDGSTDNTRDMIIQVEKKYDWIKGIFLEGHHEYLGAHISYVYNKGFEFAKVYSKEHDICWEFMAILDADTIPEPEYFEKLIQEFEWNPKLGLASGSTCEHTENIYLSIQNKNINKDFITDAKFWQTYPFSLKEKDVRKDLPMGSARIWRKECFEEIGGCFSNTHIPDAVSTVKSKMKGWETTRFKNILLIERRGLIARGHWYGYKERGASNYIVALPLFMAIMKTLNYSFKKPYYIGIAYIYGYIGYFISGKKRIEDPEVRQYYKSIHLIKFKQFFVKKLKRIIRIE